MTVTYPTTKVEIAFGYQPLNASPTYTDVSSWVQSIQTREGRQHQLARFEPANATIVLDNRDRRFDPTNTSSPYWPNVVPNVRVRITIAAVQHIGFIKAWPQDWTDGANADVSVQTVDLLGLLGNVTLPDTPYELDLRTYKPDHLYLMSDPSGTTMQDTGYAATLNAAQLSTAATGSYLQNAIFPNGPATWSVPETTGGVYWTSAPLIALTTGFTATFVMQTTQTTSASQIRFVNTVPGYDLFVGVTYNSGTQVYTIVPQYLVNGVVNGFAGMTKTVQASAAVPQLWFTIKYTYSGTVTLDVGDGSPVTDAASVGAAQYSAVRWGNTGPFTGAGTGANTFSAVAIWSSPTALSSSQITGLKNDALSNGWAGDHAVDRFSRICTYLGLSTSDYGVASYSAAADPVHSETQLGGTAIAYLQKLADSVSATLPCFPRSGLGVSNAGITLLSRADRWEQAVWNTPTYTLSDAAGATYPYSAIKGTLDREDVYNDVPIEQTTGFSYRGAVASSQASYTIRTFPSLTGLISTDSTFAKGYADWYANVYGSPQFRITELTWDLAASPTNLQTLLNLQVLQVVTVVRTPPGGGPTLTMNAVVEGISYTANAANASLTCTLNLSTADVPSGFVLDDNTHGLMDTSTCLLTY